MMATSSSSGISMMGPVIMGSPPISSFNSPALAVSQPPSTFLHPSPSPACVDHQSVPPSPCRQHDDNKEPGRMREATTQPAGSCPYNLGPRKSVKAHRPRHCCRGCRRCRGGDIGRQWNTVQRWALTDTLKRSEAAKERWVKKALLALMRRPSSSDRRHKWKDRSLFLPRTSRLSIMSKAEYGEIEV